MVLNTAEFSKCLKELTETIRYYDYKMSNITEVAIIYLLLKKPNSDFTKVKNFYFKASEKRYEKLLTSYVGAFYLPM